MIEAAAAKAANEQEPLEEEEPKDAACYTLSQDYFEQLHPELPEFSEVGKRLNELKNNAMSMTRAKMAEALEEVSTMQMAAMEVVASRINAGGRENERNANRVATRVANAESSASVQGLEGHERDIHVAGAEVRELERQQREHTAREAALQERLNAANQRITDAEKKAAEEEAERVRIAKEAEEARLAEAARTRAAKEKLRKEKQAAEEALELQRSKGSVAPSEAGEAGEDPSTLGIMAGSTSAGKKPMFKRLTREERVERDGEDKVTKAEEARQRREDNKRKRIIEEHEDGAETKYKKLESGYDQLTTHLKTQSGKLKEVTQRVEQLEVEKASLSDKKDRFQDRSVKFLALLRKHKVPQAQVDKILAETAKR